MTKTYMIENGNVFYTEYPEFHKNAERMSAKAGKAAYRAQSIETLRGMLSPGQTVYSNVVSVSRSGMSRVIRFYVVQDGAIRNISGYVATALDWSGDQDGIKVSGCGMDMCFHTVYTLGAVLWPNGTPEPHGTRNGEPDSAGGYALKSERL